MKKNLLVWLLACSVVQAQDYFPISADISAVTTSTRAIKNATIVTKPGTTLKNATILIKNGIIEAIGTSVSIPPGTVVEDGTGLFIYPSFIEPYSNFGMAKPKSAERGSSTQWDESRKGYYWNDHIRAEQNAMDSYTYDTEDAEKMVEAGYGTVQTHIADGLARGNGLLVTLNSESDDSRRIIKATSGNFYSFKRSVQTAQTYPTSLMGSLAVLRQAHFDADWYAKGFSKTKDLTLEALQSKKNLIQYIDAGEKKNILRADKLGDRIGKQFVIIGGADAYEMIDDIKATNASLIIPVNFPDAYDVTNPYQEWYVNLSDMREWKQAPANPMLLSKAGINYAITTYGLKSPDLLMAKLKSAMQYGLTKEQALAALTTQAAQIIGASNTVGSLEKGKLANFLVTSGELFEEDTKMYENWVQGKKYVIKDRSIKDLDGTYTATINELPYSFKISGSGKTIEVKTDTITLGSKIDYKSDWLTITTSQKDLEDKSFTRFVASIKADSNDLNGNAYLPSGSTVAFIAVKSATTDKGEKEKDTDSQKTMGTLTFPNIGYGNIAKPVAESVLYKNATVWTNEKDGILNNTDVLVIDGKISQVGSNLKAGKARVIDATGKHLTSGIIDEHSHIAIDQGVNEVGHNSTAEVTIEDVVDHEDVNIYRDLAGGVTTSQLLHGSANPIGGRSAIIKLKWGYKPDEMIISNSPKFIKFALGENVKQSRSPGGTRFPQTRMGVEQVFEDFFVRAREYDGTRKDKEFRYDEEMEVILEILKGERYVTCHSYVQSEVNMMLKIADKHGFTLNTFTHILEGYKLADTMAAHGAGGSTFSDWWAYKYEVNDAIPYNAALMHEQGVVVAINSDDAEMSRRLNQEAAKAVKYGDVNEEDAWKFVTLNPAKLLHIDERTGSVKAGKDADLVLWSDNPLSITAKAEITMIEGIIFFDIENDLRLRESIKKERQMLVNEMIQAKEKGLKTQAPKQSTKTLYECDSIEW
jgi:imidazolonepropionase-like amidohydrolase